MIYSTLHCLRRKTFKHCLFRSIQRCWEEVLHNQAPTGLLRFRHYRHLVPWANYSNLNETLFPQSSKVIPNQNLGFAQFSELDSFFFLSPAPPTNCCWCPGDFGPDLCDQGDQWIWGCQNQQEGRCNHICPSSWGLGATVLYELAEKLAGWK